MNRQEVNSKKSLGFVLFCSLLGVVALAYFVLSSAPASIVASALQNSQPGVSVTGEQGTVWKGNASELTLPIAGQSFSLGRVSWNVRPWSLLSLSLCLDIQSELNRQNATGHVCMKPNGKLILTDVDVSAPASIARTWQPRLTLAGGIDLHIEKAIIVDNLPQHLVGSGSWKDLRFDIGQGPIQLGSYGVRLGSTPEGELTATVLDISGPLKVDFEVRADLSEAVLIQGELTPIGELPTGFTQGLLIAGFEQHGEAYRLNLQQPLSDLF